MRPEERFDRIETAIEKQNAQIDKNTSAVRDLIVVARTCLDSIQHLREFQQKDHEEWAARMNELREAQAATDEKLNILIDTVDRIIRHRNGSKDDV
jgi:predicted secreted protein